MVIENWIKISALVACTCAKTWNFKHHQPGHWTTPEQTVHVDMWYSLRQGGSSSAMLPTCLPTNTCRFRLRSTNTCRRCSLRMENTEESWQTLWPNFPVIFPLKLRKEENLMMNMWNGRRCFLHAVLTQRGMRAYKRTVRQGIVDRGIGAGEDGRRCYNWTI